MKKYLVLIGLVTCMNVMFVNAGPPISTDRNIHVATNSNATKKLDQLKEVESLAEKYKPIATEAEKFNDARKEVMVYIRSKQYKSFAWEICAGKENVGFTNFVNDENPSLNSLRNYNLFETPYMNEKSQFVHMIGAINMAYCGFGELGSWAGDLVQMTGNLKNRYKINDDLNEAAKSLLCGNSQFTKEEMLADIDAININTMLSENEELALSEAMDQYYLYLYDCEPEERYDLYINNQFKTPVISYEKLYNEVEKILKEDALVDMLFGNYKINLQEESDIPYVDAAIKAFTDYIYLHCSDDIKVDDSYFDNIDNTQANDKPNSSGSSSGSSSSKNSVKSTVNPKQTVTMAGTWALEDSKWKYIGTMNNPAIGWQYLSCGDQAYWFYFDASGIMQTGWITDHTGQTFYLNEKSDGYKGKMVTGWNQINDKWYYFNEVSDGTKGKLFLDCVTPDGYIVNNEGVWITY